MINGRCFTNLDDYRCPVTKFVAVPRIGEKVTVTRKGYDSELKVVGVTHTEIQNATFEIVTEPYIIVELNKS